MNPEGGVRRWGKKAENQLRLRQEGSSLVCPGEAGLTVVIH